MKNESSKRIVEVKNKEFTFGAIIIIVMSSQGQKEINTIVTGSLSNTKVLVMFGVFGVAFLAGATIKDENFKIKTIT